MTITKDNSESIGRTPLVRINRLAKGLNCTILGKVEGRNPADSVKCRIGAAMIWDAEKRGRPQTRYARRRAHEREQHLGTQYRPTEVSWHAPFRMHRRIVSRLSDDRRFLIGDSPVVFLIWQRRQIQDDFPQKAWLDTGCWNVGRSSSRPSSGVRSIGWVMAPVSRS